VNISWHWLEGTLITVPYIEGLLVGIDKRFVGGRTVLRPYGHILSNGLLRRYNLVEVHYVL
jgi:hypothetical protein